MEVQGVPLPLCPPPVPMHYTVRFTHIALLLVGFIVPTLQMKRLTKSLVESDSPASGLEVSGATAGGRPAPVTSTAPFLPMSPPIY